MSIVQRMWIDLKHVAVEVPLCCQIYNFFFISINCFMSHILIIINYETKKT